MAAALVGWALRHRVPVLLGLAVVALLGGVAFLRLPVDAYPDISAEMVGIITTHPGRAPEEITRQITIPIETAMLGTPRVESVRSRTIFGLSLVQVTFVEGTESYWARQRVAERLAGIELPDGVTPELGPLATAYGEVFRYVLQSDGPADLVEQRTLHDWVVVRRLLQVPGVAEVANFGGAERQFEVRLDPAELRRHDLTLQDIADAITAGNAAGGGSVVRRGSLSLVVRGTGLLGGAADLAATPLRAVEGAPLYLRDVGEVLDDAKTRNGIFAKDLVDDAVAGIVLMRKGENPSQVLARVQAAVAELNATGLPPGVRIAPYYDRSQLVDATLHTVAHSVGLGIGLVLAVLVLFLGRFSLALLVAATIPFALLVALALMWACGVPIGLLSIGAIDFGILVEGALIMAESIARRVGATRATGAGAPAIAGVLRSAALDMAKPVALSLLLVMVAFLPLLSLTRIEGLLFRPMAVTLLFALGGALLFALVGVPVLASLLFRHGYSDWRNPVLEWFAPRYARVLGWLLRWRIAVVGLAGAGLLAAGGLILPRLGTEFLPYLDEGVVWVRARFPDGTALEETSGFGRRLRELALGFQDLEFAVVQAGRNDEGTDPFPPSRIEMMIGPRPRAQWRQFQTKHELVAALRGAFLAEFPTTRFNFTQPIIDSVTEDTNGTSANLAIEFSGGDAGQLLTVARAAVVVLAQVPGAVDVSIEQEGPQPQLVVAPDRERCARYGVRISDVMQLIDLAIGGAPIAAVYERERRFDVVARVAPAARATVEAIRELPVPGPGGVPIPLGQVANVEIREGQTIIAREAGRQRLTVRCDILGRDQGGFVAEAKRRFGERIELPPGMRVQWLGMFENLARARAHFSLLVPLTLGIVFAVLAVAFGSLRTACVLLLPVPFAVAAGAGALWLRGMNLNVSTGVGFATLFGIAIMDALLMVKGVDAQRRAGLPIDAAIVRGRLQLLRPGLITALVAILGLLPASLATGLGSDVQRPLATVIVWGLAGSTCFTLFVTPVVYRLFAPPIDLDIASSANPAVSS